MKLVNITLSQVREWVASSPSKTVERELETARLNRIRNGEPRLTIPDPGVRRGNEPRKPPRAPVTFVENSEARTPREQRGRKRMRSHSTRRREKTQRTPTIQPVTILDYPVAQTSLAQSQQVPAIPPPYVKESEIGVKWPSATLGPGTERRVWQDPEWKGRSTHGHETSSLQHLQSLPNLHTQGPWIPDDEIIVHSALLSRNPVPNLMDMYQDDNRATLPVDDDEDNTVAPLFAEPSRFRAQAGDFGSIGPVTQDETGLSVANCIQDQQRPARAGMVRGKTSHGEEYEICLPDIASNPNLPYNLRVTPPGSPPPSPKDTKIDDLDWRLSRDYYNPMPQAELTVDEQLAAAEDQWTLADPDLHTRLTSKQFWALMKELESLPSNTRIMIDGGFFCNGDHVVPMIRLQVQHYVKELVSKLEQEDFEYDHTSSIPTLADMAHELISIEADLVFQRAPVRGSNRNLTLIRDGSLTPPELRPQNPILRQLKRRRAGFIDDIEGGNHLAGIQRWVLHLDMRTGTLALVPNGIVNYDLRRVAGYMSVKLALRLLSLQHARNSPMDFSHEHHFLSSASSLQPDTSSLRKSRPDRRKVTFASDGKGKGKDLSYGDLPKNVVDEEIEQKAKASRYQVATVQEDKTNFRPAIRHGTDDGQDPDAPIIQDNAAVKSVKSATHHSTDIIATPLSATIHDPPAEHFFLPSTRYEPPITKRTHPATRRGKIGPSPLSASPYGTTFNDSPPQSTIYSAPAVETIIQSPRPVTRIDQRRFSETRYDTTVRRSPRAPTSPSPSVSQGSPPTARHGPLIDLNTEITMTDALSLPKPLSMMRAGSSLLTPPSAKLPTHRQEPDVALMQPIIDSQTAFQRAMRRGKWM